MKRQKQRNPASRHDRRRNERGAALIMMLLISMLLLAAGGALIMTTAMTTGTVYDSGPEAQAYYAAETGLEDTLNVLRGNKPPNGSTPPAPGGTIPDADKINMRRAVTRATSNAAGDPATRADGTPFPLRLSRWLNYNPNFPDRVAISPNYSPLNGTAYSISLRDPDNSSNVGFKVLGRFSNNSTLLSISGATITYTPPPPTNVPASPTATGTLGTINATYTPGIPVNFNTTLTLNISQISPWPAAYTVTGRVLFSVDALGTKNIVMTFNEATAVLGGTVMQLTTPLPINAAVSPGANTNIPVSITAPEPRRVVISSVGHGPKGARKHLEMTVDNFNFAIRPPAPICIRGSDDPAVTTTFDLGSSNAKTYIGVDASGQQPVAPAVAITRHDWTAVNDGISKGSTVQPVPPAQPGDPKLAILDHTIPASMVADPAPVPQPWVSPSPIPSSPPPPVVTPDFLRTADAAREFLYGVNGKGGLRATAQAQDRYFNAPFSGVAGNYDTGGFTFVDNNCELDGGGGLLVVTGNLVLKGNSAFRGIILVMGNGHVTRSGGGNANVRGAWMVANFNRNGPGGFGAPTFDVAGGGNADFQFDWAAIIEANRGVGITITGIAER
ncbi:MAG TPA: hypothetical protein VEY11_12610 [Pyrinomonadaceae bacterium]|nr:hypothetical protein [Pyrinomonadaceae bacterium]